MAEDLLHFQTGELFQYLPLIFYHIPFFSLGNQGSFIVCFKIFSGWLLDQSLGTLILHTTIHDFFQFM